MTIAEKRTYRMWLSATKQADPEREAQRQQFLRTFSIPEAFALLAEVENAATGECDSGLVVMQRWFRLFRLRIEANGELNA